MNADGNSMALDQAVSSEISEHGKHTIDPTSEDPLQKKVKHEKDMESHETLVAASDSSSHISSNATLVDVKAERVDDAVNDDALLVHGTTEPVEDVTSVDVKAERVDDDALLVHGTTEPVEDTSPHINDTTSSTTPMVAPESTAKANVPLVQQADDDEDDEDLFGTTDEDAQAVAITVTEPTDSVQPATPLPMPVIDTVNTEPSLAVIAPEPECMLESVVPPQETAIPRKVSTTPASSKIASPTTHVPSPHPTSVGNSKTPGTRYGLPPGVNVPASIVKSRLLEVEMNTPGSKLMDVIKSLPVNLINDALTEYDDAVEIKGAAAIRNHGAYLYGVVKRYVSVHERAISGEGTGILPMGEDGLTPMIQMRLDQLVSTGFCSSQEMNEKVKSKIRMLSEKDAIFALDELSSAERSSIRNFGSYFMGILNRYMRGDASTKNRPSVPGHQPHQHQQQHSFSQHKPNFDRPRERDRFPPPRDNHSHNPSSSSSFRDRSRDRMDDRRDFGGGGPSAYRNEIQGGGMNNNPMYDNRQQMPPQQQWQNQSAPPQQGGYGTPMGGGGAPMSHLNHSMPPQGPPMNQPGMHGMQPQPNNMNFPPPQQQPYYLQQPTQQQSSYVQQPQAFVQQQSTYPSNPLQQQQGMQNSNHGMYQHQPPMGNMLGQPQQQGLVGNPLNQQSYMPQTMPSMNQQSFASNSMNTPQSGWRQPQETPQLSIDILGLADKAASAIQALGANKISNSPGMGYPPQPQHGGHMPPQQGYPSYGGGNTMNQGQLPSMGMQQQQYPPQQQQYAPPPQNQIGEQNSFNRSNDNGQQQHPGRRRTTATLLELPATVQYTVQNLIANGSVDGQLDEGILGMIIDLPEQMALAALQKFASIDKSSMRNKTAYLAGVLRRELEKIHRR